MNKIWFIFKGTHHLGPFSVEEVEEFYLAKEINDKTMLWKEGTENWIPLYKIVDFNFLFLYFFILSSVFFNYYYY